jgi:hypothetical protein
MEILQRATTEGLSADRAFAWLEVLSATWKAAGVPEAKPELSDAMHERMVVTGRTIVFIRLTPSAYAHGFALALGGQRCDGVPDRCWARDLNLHDPDRGPG